MRLRMFKRRSAAGIASAALVGALALGLMPDASAEDAPRGDHAKTLQGTWWVQVTALTDCVSRTPLVSFTALLTFDEGGTMTGSTANPTFAVGQRTADHGIWFRDGATHTHRASSVALVLFTTPPNFPVTPGFKAGSQRLDQTIEVTDRNHFSSDAITQFFDVTGAQYREGCATAAGIRFE